MAYERTREIIEKYRSVVKTPEPRRRSPEAEVAPEAAPLTLMPAHEPVVGPSLREQTAGRVGIARAGDLPPSPSSYPVTDKVLGNYKKQPGMLETMLKNPLALSPFNPKLFAKIITGLYGGLTTPTTPQEVGEVVGGFAEEMAPITESELSVGRLLAKRFPGAQYGVSASGEYLANGQPTGIFAPKEEEWTVGKATNRLGRMFQLGLPYGPGSFRRAIPPAAADIPPPPPPGGQLELFGGMPPGPAAAGGGKLPRVMAPLMGEVPPVAPDAAGAVERAWGQPSLLEGVPFTRQTPKAMELDALFQEAMQPLSFERAAPAVAKTAPVRPAIAQPASVARVEAVAPVAPVAPKPKSPRLAALAEKKAAKEAKAKAEATARVEAALEVSPLHKRMAAIPKEPLKPPKVEKPWKPMTTNQAEKTFGDDIMTLQDEGIVERIMVGERPTNMWQPVAKAMRGEKAPPEKPPLSREAVATARAAAQPKPAAPLGERLQAYKETKAAEPKTPAPTTVLRKRVEATKAVVKEPAKVTNLSESLEQEIQVAAKKSAKPNDVLEVEVGRTKDWISSVLTNDEVSTNKELIAYFQKEGGFSPKVAEYIVSKRAEIASKPLGVRKALREVKPEIAPPAEKIKAPTVAQLREKAAAVPGDALKGRIDKIKAAHLRAKEAKKAAEGAEAPKGKEAELPREAVREPKVEGLDLFDKLRIEAESQGWSARYTPKTGEVELRAPVTNAKRLFKSLKEAWSYLENETGSFRPFSDEFAERLRTDARGVVKAPRFIGSLLKEGAREVLPSRSQMQTAAGRAITSLGRKTVDRIDTMQGIAIRDFLDPKIAPVAATKGIEGLGGKVRVNPKQFQLVGEALRDGDKFEAVYGVAELRRRGLNDDGIIAYRSTRRAVDQIYKHLEVVAKETGGQAPAYRTGYMPHRWFGRYELKVNGQKYIKPDGTSSFTHHGDAVDEAWRLMKDRSANVEILSKKQDFLDDLPEMTFLKTFRRISAAVEKSGGMTAKQLREAYVAGRKPRGFAVHFAPRKGATGYTPIEKEWDTLVRGYIASAIRYSELKRFRYKVGMDRLDAKTGLLGRIDPTKSPEEWYRAIRYTNKLVGKGGATEYVLNSIINFGGKAVGLDFYRPSVQIAGALNTATTHMKLGALNVTFPLVNLWQNALTTYPLLSKVARDLKLPAASAEKYMLKALRMYKTKEAKRILTRLAKHGVLDPKFVRAELGKFSFTKDGALKTLEKGSLALPAMTEHFNRASAGLARYYMARDMGWSYTRSYRAAKEFAESAHFRYDIADKPMIFTGPVGSVLGIFRTFSSNLLRVEGILVKDALTKGQVTPLLKHTAALVVLGGASGVPGTFLLNELVGKATGTYPLDYWNDHAPLWARYGLLTALGIDVSRRVGAGDIFPTQVKELKGATLSTLLELLYGMAEPVDTFSKQVPGIKGWYQALWKGPEVRYGSGKLAYKATPKERAQLALGVRPLRATLIQDEATKMYHRSAEWKAQRAKYIKKIMAAREAGDIKEETRLRDEARGKNLRIRGKDLQKARKKDETPSLEQQYKRHPKALRSQRLRQRIRELTQ